MPNTLTRESPYQGRGIHLQVDIDIAAERKRSWAAFRHRSIQRRAYRLWEVAGHPQGDGVPFWLEAEKAWDELYGMYAPQDGANGR